jgi:hypothetical protein
MRGWLTVGLACVLVATTQLGAAEADAVFVLPRAELVTSVKTIGVMPVDLPAIVPDADEVAARLEQEIVARLQQGGFNVVAPAAARAVKQRGQEALGGAFDPMTGLAIPERVEALGEFMRHEYQALHPVDAILYVAVVRRTASFSMGSADWDGVRERVSNERGVTGVMQGILSGMKAAAEVSALSLAVKLTDPNGRLLYSAFGGLLVLSYPTLYGTFVAYDLSAVDPKKAMGDPAVGARALAIAIDPLATGVVPQGRASFTLPLPPEAPKTPVIALKEILRDHRRIAVAPLEMPETPLKQRDIVRTRYGELIPARLAAVGFEVVATDEFAALWAAERDAAGGFYDRFTGRRDVAKLTTARKHVLAALKESSAVSALAVPSIVERLAPFKEGQASWDGVVQPVSKNRGLSALGDNSSSYAGGLPALSLKLQIIDDTGTLLFDGMGGIQLTSQFQNDHEAPLAERELFAKPGNDALAVECALSTLTAPKPHSH